MAAQLPIIGLGLAFASSVFGGIAAHQAAGYQSAIAEMNEKVAKDNAARARHTAQVEQQDQDMVARAMLGEQIAEQSASGFSLGSSSFALARKSAQELARKDALNIRHEGEVTAHNYLVDAANFNLQGQGARSAGRNALLAGFLGGATTLAGGDYGGSSLISSAFKTKRPQWQRPGGIGHM